MEPQIRTVDGVAVVTAPGVVIETAQDALDLMASIRYLHDVDKAALDKTILAEAFFELRTGLAGEILQKFTNYQFVVALYGDFSGYESKALRDFIYECNQGNQVFFVPDQATAIERLSQ